MNKVMLIGHLGRDPEVRSTPNGTAVTNFSIATSRRWKDRDGNKQEQTEWHHVVAWGKLAEICGQYLVKGKLVYLEGRLQTRSWEDRNNGEKRYKTEVVLDEMKMLGGGGGEGERGERGGGRQGSGGGGVSYDYGEGQEEPDDDDIPF